jgi:hypothetical protein
MQADAQKVADHNGYRPITRPSQKMAAGLKILVSLCSSAGACRVENCAESGWSSMEGPSRGDPLSRGFGICAADLASSRSPVSTALASPSLQRKHIRD